MMASPWCLAPALSPAQVPSFLTLEHLLPMKHFALGACLSFLLYSCFPTDEHEHGDEARRETPKPPDMRAPPAGRMRS